MDYFAQFLAALFRNEFVQPAQPWYLVLNNRPLASNDPINWVGIKKLIDIVF